eukprot:1421511-Prymnesium_polylepis.1
MRKYRRAAYRPTPPPGDIIGHRPSKLVGDGPDTTAWTQGARFWKTIASGHKRVDTRGSLLENNHLSVHRHARLAFMQPPQSFVLRRARGEKAWGIRISTTDASQGMANALSAVSSDSPAARAGLLVGDTICAVNGARCQHDGDAARYLKLCSGPVELRVSREAPASESAAAGKKRRHSAIKEPDPTPAS